MPLTSKGNEIKSAMIKEYGEKKGTSVFYASKNKGNITGVDACSCEDCRMGATPDHEISISYDTTGEAAVTQTKTAISPFSSAASADKGRIPARDVMSKLPTVDQFRKRFRDAVAAGYPLDKCLDLGTVWNGSNTGAQKFQGDRKAFRKRFNDAMTGGMPVAKAIAFATDDMPDMSGSPDVTSSSMSSTTPMVDKRHFFRSKMRDALKAGKGWRGAIHDATQE